MSSNLTHPSPLSPSFSSVCVCAGARVFRPMSLFLVLSLTPYEYILGLCLFPFIKVETEKILSRCFLKVPSRRKNVHTLTRYRD